MALLTWKNFDKHKIIFEEPKRVYTKDEKLKAHRIAIKYKYSKTEIDKLHIKTPVLFSWGIQDNNFSDTRTFPLVMFDSNIGATKEEEDNIKLFETILKCCKKYLLKDETKNLLDCYDLDHLINTMDIFYRKKDKGIIIPEVAPVLYPKLRINFRKSPADPIKITTRIFNKANEKIDPQILFNQKCRAMCDIVVEEIFKGVKPSIQVKIDTIIIIENCDVPRRLFLEDSDIDQSSENDDNEEEDDDNDDSDDDEDDELKHALKIRKKLAKINLIN